MLVDAVSVSSPSNVSGSPSASRSQRTTMLSNSDATGDERQSIALATNVDMNISPRMPGADALLGKYAKNAGCCQWVMLGAIVLPMSARISSRGSGTVGTG